MSRKEIKRQEVESIIEKIDRTIFRQKTTFRETKVRSNGLAEYKSIAVSMELPQANFVKVPLFLGYGDENEINVCSLCFSALTLVYSTEKLCKDYSDFLKRIVNTLVFLHLHQTHNGGKYIFWPSSYNIAQSQKETGTIDQTTSCLSVLYKVGFAERRSTLLQSSVSDHAIRERLSFVKKSIEWILDLQVTDIGNVNYGGWPYSDACVSENEQPICAAVLPTFYCIKTLQKYICLFTKDEFTQQFINSFNDGIIIRMTDAVDRGVDYLCLHQRKLDGGIPKNSMEVENASILHSLLSLESLVKHSKGHMFEIKKYLLFLSKYSVNRTFKMMAEDSFECFRYRKRSCLLSEEYPPESIDDSLRWKDTYQLEQFEWFIETIIISTYISLAEKLYSETDDPEIKRAIKKIEKLASIAFKSLYNRILEIRNNTYVKGRRSAENEQFPIYCEYYAKMVLTKLVQNPLLLQKLQNKRFMFFS